MVGVAQLVEHWVVAPVVAGSIPVTHPIKIVIKSGGCNPPFFCAHPEIAISRFALSALFNHFSVLLGSPYTAGLKGQEIKGNRIRARK